MRRCTPSHSARQDNWGTASRPVAALRLLAHIAAAAPASRRPRTPTDGLAGTFQAGHSWRRLLAGNCFPERSPATGPVTAPRGLILQQIAGPSGRLFAVRQDLC